MRHSRAPLGEEEAVGDARFGPELVAVRFELRNPAAGLSEVADADQQIDDRLGVHAFDGGAPHVLDRERRRAQQRAQPRRLFFEEGLPLGPVRHDAHRASR